MAKKKLKRGGVGPFGRVVEGGVVKTVRLLEANYNPPAGCCFLCGQPDPNYSDIESLRLCPDCQGAKAVEKGSHGLWHPMKEPDSDVFALPLKPEWSIELVVAKAFKTAIATRGGARGK
jgi:hypothetical protein